MEYAILLAIIALAAWLVLRVRHPEPSSKHGFTPHDEEAERQTYLAKAALTEEKLSQFVAENDVPIRDVLEDYRTTHHVLGTVHSCHTVNSARWRLGIPAEPNKDTPPATCEIEVAWSQSYSYEYEKWYGKPCFQFPQITIHNAREGELLARALDKILKRSKVRGKYWTSSIHID